MSFLKQSLIPASLLAASLLLFVPSLRAGSPILTSPAQAFSESARLQRPVLLIFTGSDWCVPCIQFHKKVLDDSAFQRFADSSLVLLEADFPQHRRIPDSVAAAYDALAVRYNPDGAFPKMLLLDNAGNVLAETPWQHTTTAEFVLRLRQELKKQPRH